MTQNDRTLERRLRRRRRHYSIRKKIRGTVGRPRLVVFRSLRHMEGQLVDDDQGRTLLGVSTRSAAVDAAKPTGDPEEAPDAGGSKVRESYAAGHLLAERALEAGVKEVVFDRAGYRFQGRVKAFAEGARAGGLRF